MRWMWMIYANYIVWSPFFPTEEDGSSSWEFEKENLAFDSWFVNGKEEKNVAFEM